MAQVEQLGRRDPSSPAYIALRERFIAARKAAGFSQASLAKRIGRPQSFIAKVEVGERNLDVVEFAKISRVIGLDVKEALNAIIAA